MLYRFVLLTGSLVLVSMIVEGGAPVLAQIPASGSAQSSELAGDPAAGKAVWNDGTRWCKRCHGENADGGWGPDLAGRGLAFEQVRRAIRQPWALMPAYVDSQLSDKQIADLTAFFASMPRVAEPHAPRFVTPSGGSLQMKYAIDYYGCAQCHEPEFSNPRRVLGGVAGIANLDYFKKQVYEHTSVFPRGIMGNYSRDRVPEAAIEEIYKYVMSYGLRPILTAAIAPPRPGDTTYTLTVKNEGVKASGGLAAEDLTISLVLPQGVMVTQTTGRNYQGVKHDASANADAAVWTLPRLGPEEDQVFSVTLSGANAAAGIQRGSAVRWLRPDAGRSRPGYPQLPGGEYRDARIQDGPGDFVAVNLARPTPAAR
jgi:mono/diheme cytochrome c family protein